MPMYNVNRCVLSHISSLLQSNHLFIFNLLFAELVECDEFNPVSLDVHFPNGTTIVRFPINVTTNDDIYEGDESFTLEIVDPGVNHVVVGEPNTAKIVITDDEKRE